MKVGRPMHPTDPVFRDAACHPRVVALSTRRRRALVAHYASARSCWLNDPAAKNPFPLVCGREYPGGL